MNKILAPVAVLLATTPVLLGHPGHGESGVAAGAMHPLHGLDHILAMIAVGLMGVRCATGPMGNRHALWLVPATFMAAMAAGSGLALAGVPMPGVEWGIALSVLVFGVIVALGTAPRTWVACLVAGAFALLHGHAHIAEMGDTSVLAYMGGFLATTGLLHAGGVLAGWCIARAWSTSIVRLAGAGVALASFCLFAALV